MFISCTNRNNQKILVSLTSVTIIRRYTPDSFDKGKEIPSSMIFFIDGLQIAVKESLEDLTNIVKGA